MKKKLIIFGTGKIAEVVYHCFLEAAEYQVIGFTCDQRYKYLDTFLGLPVISFEDLSEHWSPSEHACFVALGYQDINKLRTEKVLAVKAKGYQLASYIASDLKYASSIEVEEHCFIMSGVNLQPCCFIGQNTFLWSGATIGHHAMVGANCWVTSGVNIAGNATIGDGSFLGINSTISNDVVIGSECFLGANVLVTKKLPDETVVIEPPSQMFRLKTNDFLKVSLFK